MAQSEVPANLKERMKDSYDAIATTYNTWSEKETDTALRTKYLDQLIPHLTAIQGEKHVLELGCGAGKPATENLLDIADVIVIANDLSATQITLAKQNLAHYDQSRIKYNQGDMMSLEFPPASLDAVIAMYSVIHLPTEEQITIIARIHTWLKPGGFILANFASQPLPGLVAENWLEHEKGWIYWSSLGAERTLAEIKKTGFGIVLEEVSSDAADADFLWVLAQK
jgi:ubiquinone/menaquinone biosynthesis C-methylase UbiE